MKRLIRSLLPLLFAPLLLLPGACGSDPGPAATDDVGDAATESVPTSEGLPGGGHCCRWRAGIWNTLSTPSCGPSIPLSPANLSSHCACAPIALWC